jgi:eukaryotic-like serine/threonine-protein kinase
MGEVFAARDSRLGRDVAIKILPPALSGDADRVRRFEQEARAAGSMNHPNLVTMHDIGVHDGSTYVVMELLEGETLREKLGGAFAGEGAPIPLRKVVDYSVQIANGLAAAHDKGIIHRDLKPENLFVTRDGRVKILDFGLAKLTSAREGVDLTGAPTEEQGTAPGTVMGTAGYMSPEQIRGGTLDHRTDIFSLGAVVYEMLSGRRAFRRNTSVETMNAILKDDPPELLSARPDVAPGVERIVLRCLEKAPEERFHSAHDVAFALQAVSTTSAERVAERPWFREARRRLAILVLSALALGAIAGWIAGSRGRITAAAGIESTAGNARRFVQITLESRESAPALDPDGKTVAFVSDAAGRRDIYVQRVDGRNAINLTADSKADDTAPAFSPDGRHIAFRSERNGGGIFVMGATGESVRRLTDFGFNPAWSPDGTQIAVGTDQVRATPSSRDERSELWIIDVASGSKRRLLEQDAVQPAWSPGGARIAYWATVGHSGQRDLFTVDPFADDPVQSVTRVTEDAAVDWNPLWSADGKWLYFGSDRGGSMNLWRVAIDEASGERRGEPEPITVPALSAGEFTIARNSGAIAYAAKSRLVTVYRFPFDPETMRAGRPTEMLRGTLTPLGGLVSPSPDGKQWVFSSFEGHQEDLYLIRDDGTGLRQLTSDPHLDRAPSFSADGDLIYFYSERTGRYQIWSIRPDGSGLRQVTSFAEQPVVYPRPFPGRDAIYGYDGDGSVVLPLKADGTADRIERLPPVDDEGSVGRQPRISADGTAMVVYVGNVGASVAMRGTWAYSFTTNEYSRLGPTWAPQWVGSSNRLVLAIAAPTELIAYDLAAGTSRRIAVPVRAIHGFNLSPDGRVLVVVEQMDTSVVWLVE